MNKVMPTIDEQIAALKAKYETPSTQAFVPPSAATQTDIKQITQSDERKSDLALAGLLNLGV